MGMTWMWWWNVQDRTVVGTGSEVSGPGERGQGILMLAPVRLARFVKRERERERERDCSATSGPCAVTAPRPREQADPPSPPDRLPSLRGGHPSSQTASAAARLGLVHSARALAAAALLALVGGLALPATAQAQSETLVTNLSYSDDGFLAVALRSAQSFGTGDHSAGYKLDAVELRIKKPTGSTRGLEVKLYTESASGNPANVLFTFPALAIPTGTGNLRFEAPAGTRLDPNTTYFIVFKQSGGSGVNSSAGTTKNLGQTGFDNWSIADKRTYHGGSWTSVQGEAYRMTVLGVAASTDATLSGLTVTGGGSDLVTFVSGTETYTASVASTVAEVTVTPALNDSNATIEYLDGDDATLTDAGTADGHQVTLTGGDNVIKVKVTASNGSTTKTYTVTVTRADTTAPTLTRASVAIAGDTTALWFSEDLDLPDSSMGGLSTTIVGAFSVTVAGVGQEIQRIDRGFGASGANRLTVAHSTIYSGQTVVVSYDQSAASTDAIADAAGNEVADFTTGSDGVPAVTNGSTATPSSDATLSDLVVNDGNANLTLTPTFASDTTTYTAMVANAVAAVTLTPTTTDTGTGATIEYLDGDDATLTDADAAAGHQVAVAEGDNVIKVKVTAADGNATQTYVVTVDRAAAVSNCTLNTDDRWCGVVTVGTYSNGVGFTDSDGALTDNTGDQTIAIASGNYTVSSVVILTSPAGALVMGLDTRFQTGDETSLVFHIGSSTFKVSEATFDTGVGGYIWRNSGLSWSVGDMVDVRLRRTTGGAVVPVVTIAADKTLVWDFEGTAGFTLSRTGPTAATLTVTVEVTQEVDRDLLPDGAEAERTVTFAVNSATTALSVALENDDLSELAGDLTVEVQAGSGYTVGDPASATVEVRDGDEGNPQPANLMAEAGAGVGEVALSWDAHAPHLTFYRHQYRYKTDGNYAAWTDIPNSGQHTGGDGSNLTGYTVTGLVGGQSHTFQVRTHHLKPDGITLIVSDSSNEATATPRSADPTTDAPGVEGDLRLTDEESYTHPDGHEGVSGRAEIFHAGRWGTVSSDGFSRDTTSRFIEDLDTNGDPLGTFTYGEVANNAPALFCQAMGYDTGEYASGFGRPEVPSQRSESEMPYYPVGSTYPPDGPEPIWVDDMTCAAGDADLTVGALPAPMAHCGFAGWGLHNSNHGEDAGVRCWNEPESDAGRSYDPLTAAFEGLPEAHDGETAFSFRLAFSEAVAVTPEAMRTRVLTAAGGAVTGAARVDGESGVWEITVTPDSREDLSIALAPTEDCEAAGAVCTSDGRALSVVPAHIVPGPGPETGPSLTASFEGLPEAHDGEDTFHFRVAFSEDIGISFRSMRDASFTVDGGEVTGARRVEGRHDLWQITVAPDGDGEVTVTLAAGRACAVSGAICTRGGDRRQLTNTPTATVAGPPVVPLTADFVQKPYEHDGETAFTLRIAFSEGIAIGFRTFRDQSVSVSGGSVTHAKRVDRRKDLWKVTVEPGSRGDVTVTLAGGRACGTAGAVCTSDGRALSAGISTTVLGPAALTVADARAKEGTDETLDFTVSLSRATRAAVTVAYATADGTATAGSDYTATSGTLTFAAGETEQTVLVPVLDDAHDEGEETLTLRLTNATGAVIADGEATGTIKNTDHLQRAWLARFGRTAATHVTDAVGERLRDGSGASHVTVGGYRLPLEKRGATDGADDGVSGVERLVLALGQRLGLGTGTAPAGAGGVAGAGGWPDAPVATDPRLGQSRTLDVGNAVNLRQVLLGSSFRLSLGAAATGSAGPRLTAWGRVAGTTFDGREGKVSLDGDVLTGTMGVDGEWDRLLAGLAVAHSRGDGSYTMPVAGGDDSGNLEQTLTSIHPYLRYAVNDRLDVWGLFGYGWGDLTLEKGTGTTYETDTTLAMGAFGGRGILLPAGETGGFELATRTDAMLTRTSSDAVAGMASADAEAHRLRLVLEGSRGFAWAEGRSLTPTMEVGLRHDWGDAETGFGLELGGRVHYADPALGLTIEAAVRGLLAHEDDDYQEWGASGSLRLAPGAGGQGLALTLAPTWGAASSGVNGLWSRQTTAGLAPQGNRQTPAGRLNAEIGYGVAAPFGTGLLTPYAGTVLSDGAARTYRVGGRLQMRGGWATGLTLNLEGTRQDPAGQQPVNQSLRLQLTWGF